jgi:hypothetical protein
MTTPRYATNAFTNFAQYEAGVFSAGEAQSVLDGDNPNFIWPDKSLLNAPMGTRQPIQRGYMRMIADGFDKNPRELNRRRLHFQFNPDNIVRSVTARNDVQMWMNQDPIQLTQAVPGDANFSFELMFNREAEVNSATYRLGNGTTAASNVKATLPIDNPGAGKSTTLSASAVTDIGVLADLIVFDELIGQGVNSQLIDKILQNAKKKSNLERTAALKAAASNVPTSTARAKVTTIANGKITKIKVEGGGSGYVSAPFVQVTGGAGKGTGEFTAVVDTKTGKVTEVRIESGGTGSGYVAADITNNTIKVSFIGGGTGGNTTSSKSTSDAQDQIPPKFDDTAATQALTANYGNSAFLVSTPVRIVFSSLFMVEGYITATQVTFNKFNPNMVPTQCLVGITMQALYIGFARDKTYLTKTLKEALETADTEGDLDTTDTTPDANEQAALKSLSKNLFKKVSKINDSNKLLDKTGAGNILGGDQKDSIGFTVTASNELKNLQAGGTNKIDKMSQDVTITVTYKGNSNSAITNLWPVGQKFVFTNDASNWNENDFGRGDPKDTLECEMKLTSATPLSKNKVKTSGYAFDETSTSKWDYEIVVKTFVTPASGSGGFWAKQIIKGTKRNVKWSDEFNFGDILTLVVEP